MTKNSHFSAIKLAKMKKKHSSAIELAKMKEKHSSAIELAKMKNKHSSAIEMAKYIVGTVYKLTEISRDLIGSLLFPSRCPVCDEILEPEYDAGIHPECESRLIPVGDNYCMHCGRPLGLEVAESTQGATALEDATALGGAKGNLEGAAPRSGRRAGGIVGLWGAAPRHDGATPRQSQSTGATTANFEGATPRSGRRAGGIVGLWGAAPRYDGAAPRRSTSNASELQRHSTSNASEQQHRSTSNASERQRHSPAVSREYCRECVRIFGTAPSRRGARTSQPTPAPGGRNMRTSQPTPAPGGRNMRTSQPTPALGGRNMRTPQPGQAMPIPSCDKYTLNKPLNSYVTSGRAMYLYQGAIKKSMYRFKYSNKREYADFFANQAVEKYGNWIEQNHMDVIVPVPMYEKKKRIRGYNQAESFARALSKRTGIPVDTNLVKRVKDTPALKNLSDVERKNNLKSAFQKGKSIVQYRQVLVVDDIYTTGATVEAVAQEIKNIWGCQVYVLSICIGRDM